MYHVIWSIHVSVARKDIPSCPSDAWWMFSNVHLCSTLCEVLAQIQNRQWEKPRWCHSSWVSGQNGLLDVVGLRFSVYLMYLDPSWSSLFLHMFADVLCDRACSSCPNARLPNRWRGHIGPGPPESSWRCLDLPGCCRGVRVEGRHATRSDPQRQNLSLSQAERRHFKYVNSCVNTCGYICGIIVHISCTFYVTTWPIQKVAYFNSKKGNPLNCFSTICDRWGLVASSGSHLVLVLLTLAGIDGGRAALMKFYPGTMSCLKLALCSLVMYLARAFIHSFPCENNYADLFL